VNVYGVYAPVLSSSWSKLPVMIAGCVFVTVGPVESSR
jgi:hypothetical protein